VRYPAEHKLETRDLILTEAAKQIRAHGPLGVGVADIMKKAGLTHGGFYAHFKSKDALVAAAIGKMFESARTRWEKTAGLGAYIDWYLSAEHRDARETGCPVVALASDVPRLSKACRTAYAAGARAFVERIASVVGDDVTASSIVAELVGALALARVEPDPGRSDQLLAASRRALRERIGVTS